MASMKNSTKRIIIIIRLEKKLKKLKVDKLMNLEK